MDHFYVIKWKRWRNWIVLSLALFTAIFIWVQQDNVFSVFTTEKSAALSKGNAKEPAIALTFNISWGEEKALDILDELSEQGVTATFFVSGEWAERHPDILKRITEDKHELGMLGYRYKSYLDQELSQVRKDLNYAREVFGKLGYTEVNLLRTPSGHFNKEILDLAESMDFQVIHWNVNPNDWENPGASAIVDTVMKETDNGAIVLLHASDSAKHTAEALRTILPGLKNKGYLPVTVSEMMNQAHADTKLVE